MGFCSHGLQLRIWGRVRLGPVRTRAYTRRGLLPWLFLPLKQTRGTLTRSSGQRYATTANSSRPLLQRQDSGSVALFLTAASVAVNTGRSSTPTPNRNTNREPDALFMHKMTGEPRPCRSFPKNSLSAQRCTRAPIAHRFQFAQHLWRLTLSPVHAPDSRLPASPWPAARRH